MSSLTDFYPKRKMPAFCQAIYELANNAASGTAYGVGSDPYNVIPFNTIEDDFSSGITLSGGIFTVPAGIWRVQATFCSHMVNDARGLLLDNSDDSEILRGVNHYSNSGSNRSQNIHTFDDPIVLTATTDVKFVAYCTTQRNGDGLGDNVGTGSNERYANALFINLEKYHYE